MCVALPGYVRLHPPALPSPVLAYVIYFLVLTYRYAVGNGTFHQLKATEKASPRLVRFPTAQGSDVRGQVHGSDILFVLIRSAILFILYLGIQSSCPCEPDWPREGAQLVGLDRRTQVQVFTVYFLSHFSTFLFSSISIFLV